MKSKTNLRLKEGGQIDFNGMSTVLSYFMPRGQRIVFIVCSYLHFYVVVS